MMSMRRSQESYLVAGSKPWSKRVFEEQICQLPGDWVFVATQDELLEIDMKLTDPRYIFFLHWSWIVPPEIVNDFECVCFHMTDLPYGRGGSPLQNLIVRGHAETHLTALRMTNEIDAGPIYFKRPMSLSGTAEQIYIRSTELSADMIADILIHPNEPIEQDGAPVRFTRREPGESEIPGLTSLDEIADFIRMLDADGYPPAFIESKGFRFEFRRSARYEGRVIADVTIVPIDGFEV